MLLFSVVMLFCWILWVLVISVSRLDLLMLFGLIRLIMWLFGMVNVMLFSVCVLL